MSSKNRNPKRTPIYARFLFHLILPDSDCWNLMGDYEEIYNDIIRYEGLWMANFWLIKQVVKSWPLYLYDSIRWRMSMFKNYLTIAFRNILKQKAYSFINIAGLALGMACCLFILLWVMDELSSDRFHENAEYLYRVEQDQNYSGENFHVNVTPYPMGPALTEEIPEILQSCRITNPGEQLFRYGEKAFFENGITAVDTNFLNMFTFPLLKGDKNTALADPYNILVTEEIAEKYFGVEDPIGKTVTLNNNYAFTVTGVLNKVPDNSQYQFDMLIPFHYIREIGQYNESWSSNNIPTLVQLVPNALITDVNEKITKLRHKKVMESIADAERRRQFIDRPMLQFSLNRLTDIYLRGYFGFGRPMGNIQYVYIFIVIASFVLLIACINFMNLATARSAGRAREVGLRKVVGAFKSHLIGQFYGEAILLSFLSLFLALLLVGLLLPQFNTISGKTLALSALFTWKFLLGMIFITLLTGILSGSYPALYLSAFQPVAVLKGALGAGLKSATFRKILVVVQFSLSVLLIIGTSIIYKQVDFMRKKELGYDKEHLIYFPLRGETKDFYASLKEELKNDPRVVNVTATWQRPTSFGANAGGAQWEGKDPEENVLIGMNSVDFDYVETMGIEMAEGRAFNKTFSTDTAGAWIVNEEVVKLMNVESAVNMNFRFIGAEGPIVGVMKNYHYQSIQSRIDPLALLVVPSYFNFMVIRLGSGDIPDALAYVQETWERMIPNYPFDYQFLDEDFDRMFRSEERMGTLLQTFTGLAIVIACLGLFGLASFTAEQRTKEIGIRKVLGASTPKLLYLLNKEFTKWVVVANVIAWPAAYFILSRWLQEFAYRTSLPWWIFIGSGVIALAGALLTVSYQSLKAALINPADSLKYE